MSKMQFFFRLVFVSFLSSLIPLGTQAACDVAKDLLPSIKPPVNGSSFRLKEINLPFRGSSIKVIQILPEEYWVTPILKAGADLVTMQGVDQNWQGEQPNSVRVRYLKSSNRKNVSIDYYEVIVSTSDFSHYMVRIGVEQNTRTNRLRALPIDFKNIQFIQNVPALDREPQSHDLPTVESFSVKVTYQIPEEYLVRSDLISGADLSVGAAVKEYIRELSILSQKPVLPSKASCTDIQVRFLGELRDRSVDYYEVNISDFRYTTTQFLIGVRQNLRTTRFSIEEVLKTGRSYGKGNLMELDQRKLGIPEVPINRSFDRVLELGGI